MTNRTRAVCGLGLSLAMSACAAPPAAKSPPSAQDAAAAPAPEQASGYPQQMQPGYAPPPLQAAPTRPGEEPRPAPATPAAGAPAGGAAQSGSRAAAIQSASRDVEASLRELDVAAGDCHNACRALGSMDRAAGRLCGLAQETDEQKRCDGAKDKLYSARDRVRATCGSCPGGASVDRSAPVPSIR